MILNLDESIKRTSQLPLNPDARRRIGITRPTKDVIGPVNQLKIPA